MKSVNKLTRGGLTLASCVFVSIGRVDLAQTILLAAILFEVGPINDRGDK